MQNFKKGLLIVLEKNKNGWGQKGVALYLALLIMAILLSIGIALSVILMGQMKMIRGMGDSVTAFYAADTGIEEALLSRDKPVDIPKTFLDKDTSYEVTVFYPNSDCDADNYCIRSVGIYRGVRRAIEVEY